MRFLKNATGNKLDGNNAALDMTKINNTLEIAALNGANGIDTILCNPTQARKISAFNTSGINPVVQRGDTTTGSYVTTYVSDQGEVLTIVADRNFAKNEVAFLDSSKINLVALRPFSDENAANA